MKKVISAILAIMMIATLSISAFALNTDFYMEDGAIKVTVSDEYDVFTEGYENNSVVAERINVTEDYLKSYLDSQNICFYALEKNFEDEISVMTMPLSDPEINVNNFKELTYSEVETVYSNMKTAVESNGGTISAYERCTIGNAEYIKVYRNFAMNDVYDLVFYTIANGREYYIDLTSYLGEVTAEQEASFTEFVSYINYNYYSYGYEETEPVIEETEPEYDDYYYDDYYEEETYYEDDNKTVGTDTERTGLIAKVTTALGAMGVFGIIIAAAVIGLPILFFIFIIILIIVIVVVVKKKKKKKAMEAANAENVAVAENVVIAENPAVAETEATENETKTE